MAVSAGYLYLRYTKEVYESVSIVQLNFESEASMLNITSPVVGEGLPEEIELLKSRLFFEKVAEAVNLDVTYVKYGRILDDERFCRCVRHPLFRRLYQDRQ